jgi:hypothetical protein
MGNFDPSAEHRSTSMRSKVLSNPLVAFAVAFGMPYEISFGQGAVSEPGDGDWLRVDHDLAATRYSCQ